MAKIGDLIEIIYMSGEPQYTGKTGRVESINVDPWGDTALRGTWGGCSVYEGQDSYRIIAE